MPAVEKNKMSAEEEIEFVKLIEEKTGEIVPGNALNLLTVTLDDLEKLLTIKKLSKNQKKKVLRRKKWVSLIDSVKDNFLVLASRTTRTSKSAKREAKKRPNKVVENSRTENHVDGKSQ